MPRFRRYRVFLLFAAAIVYLFVRFAQRDDWPGESGALGEVESVSREKGEQHGAEHANQAKLTAQPSDIGEPRAVGSESRKTEEDATSSAAIAPQTASDSQPSVVASSAARPPTIPGIGMPERKPPPANTDESGDDLVDDVHPIAPPARQEVPSPPPGPAAVHWKSQTQHFPVPTESIIQLPTGTPLKIRKIQHDFERETYEAITIRENRQIEVKDAFQKAWAGYKEHAWLHDEISPVSGKFRDPFCGWAATLVDSLDTLWIMGLTTDFEEAARAVDLIDFTTSARHEIPVFETTIRYLGGLLAAYDVSGGKYKNLLDKAVELAEILLGAFDTPNRMPVLHYNWRPAFASQPHRASQQSNLAELGSLSLEFTRLAQLTNDARYYDAIDRVADALLEWQNRGTPLDGVFTEEVDASGCNRTAVPHPKPIAPPSIVPDKDEEQVLGYQPAAPDTVKQPKPMKQASASSPEGPGTLKVQITPGEPSKAQILNWEDTHPNQEKQALKRDLDNQSTAANTTPTPTRVHPVSGRPLAAIEARGEESEHCVPQGLTTSRSVKFSMGGGQDSTYEYMPKQFLLLGGLEDKYQKMYMKTIKAIHKRMLYRPMVPTSTDILFTGALSPRSGAEDGLELSHEIEHLACFVGGMVGMAAKIFDIKGDVEIAKQLTDGCVWAYNSTGTGIMPEGGTVLPCESMEHCPWDKKTYYRALDPSADSRSQRVVDYIANKKTLEEAKQEKDAETKQAEDAEAAKSALEAAAAAAEEKNRVINVEAYPDPPHKEDDETVLRKRETDTPKELTSSERLYQEKSNKTEAELRDLSKKGRDTEAPLQKPKEEAFRDPDMPRTHEEYVENVLESNRFPPGYVSIRSKKYILRPEAIESVWYMYRITGDTSWQDKGWHMFKSIVDATATKHGHSAIADVTADPSSTIKLDEMESFWLGETLKYFYLLYSTPDTISLDEWVLNTEAHAFKRPS